MRFIVMIDVDDSELTRVGCKAQDLVEGIEARLHPVVSCHPDEIVSKSVIVTYNPKS